ncbi:MAG: GGDEF domain-containing protein [Candidatus Thiodiazotropha sp.]|jgi:diguanylate cyclase (GGDEF)-like protein
MTGIYNIYQDQLTPAPRTIVNRQVDVVDGDGKLGLILELSGKLQTTLEVETLIELFSQTLEKQFEIDCLNYCSTNKQIALAFGATEATNKLSYNLKVLDTRLGQITVSRKKRYSKREISEIENLLAALLYPLRNALLYRTALQSAFLDSLTKVKNRTAFDSNFSRELELNRRNNSNLSLIVMDIDFFKRINDQFGHAIGDMVLVEVAKTIEQTIRSSDALYRYGGEEFVVILNGTDMAGAQLLAARIRENVENMRIDSIKSLRVTLSLGVSMLHEQDNNQTLFERADRALYEAKNSGRNRVVGAN